jgi:hypothetical protein
MNDQKLTELPELTGAVAEQVSEDIAYDWFKRMR